MSITKNQLAAAVDEKIITPQQATALQAFWQTQSRDAPKFTLTHVLYYLGGIIAIGAMTLFMNLGWKSFGGAGIFTIACIYAALGLKITS